MEKRFLPACTYNFPRATDVIIEDLIFHQLSAYVPDLERIVSLTNLTCLQVLMFPIPWDELMKILLETPNLVTLVAVFFTISLAGLNTYRESANFRTVASSNIIREFTIGRIRSETEAEFIRDLFPRLKILNIGRVTHRPTALMRTLLSNRGERACHLHSVSAKIDCARYLNQIPKLTGEGHVFAGFSYKVSSDQLHLWR